MADEERETRDDQSNFGERAAKNEVQKATGGDDSGAGDSQGSKSDAGQSEGGGSTDQG